VSAVFAVLIPKGSAFADTLKQSPEVSLHNVHSIDNTWDIAVFVPLAEFEYCLEK